MGAGGCCFVRADGALVLLAGALRRLPVGRAAVPRHVEQPTQNWSGQGESDCLIKTKHCDGVGYMLTQCDFCPVL